MTLTTYLEKHGISAAEFARKIGAKSRMTVTRYCRGDRMPPRDAMNKIVEVTGGEVTHSDFYSRSEAA